jgi:NAD-dependent dihydropyrimidine dehydrogenase PreA subunit
MPPIINHEKCDGCGGCIFQCGAMALKFNYKSYKVYLHLPKTCVDCFICENYCPRQAITIKLPQRKGK